MVDIKNDQEFNQWLRKNYTCRKCEKELFSFFGEQITTKFFIREHLPEMTIHFGEPGKITFEPTDKGKYCKKCKEKLEKQEKNWIYELTNLTKPIKEQFSIFHREKLRKTPIPAADQAKVIEFYKQKHCSPELKCSQCGDFSVYIKEDEEGIIQICEENYNDENAIYCKECIKEKNQTGSMWSGDYLYDIWEEWKKENKTHHNLEDLKNKRIRDSQEKVDELKIIERNLKLENESKNKNNSPLFTILTIALIIETLVIFAGITYLIIKKKVKK